jgi:hypothetical protein
MAFLDRPTSVMATATNVFISTDLTVRSLCLPMEYIKKYFTDFKKPFCSIRCNDAYLDLTLNSQYNL